jgi:pimeloyl-ACP methyl ester carboxylesterase
VGDEAAYRSAEQRYWDAAGVRPTEEWYDLPRTGSRVRVQVVGDGPPVVFLHGVNTSGTVFAPLAAALQQFRCLVVDRPGCGLSTPLPRRIEDVAAFADYTESFTVELLDAAGLEGAPIVATSLGGYTALRSASAHPDRVAAVVQLGWTVGAPNEHLPLVMRFGGSRRLGQLMARMPTPKAAIRPMLSRIGLREAVQGGRVSDEMVDWFHALLAHTGTMRNELEGSPTIIRFRGLDESVLLPDTVLSRIRVPVTFLWGDGDPFGDPEVARAFAARVPGSSLTIVPNAGHAVWMDDLDAVARATGDALTAATT